MKKHTKWAVVLFVSLLAIGGVAAAVTYTGTLSEHSSQSDFEGDDVHFQNLTIQGSGENATITKPPEENGSSVGYASDSSGTQSSKSGVRLTPNTDLSGFEFTTFLTDPTHAYVINESGTIIATEQFSGDNGSIRVSLEEGKSYQVVFDADGSSYMEGRDTSPGLPENTTDFEVLSGVVDGSDTSHVGNVKNLTAIKGGATASYTGYHTATNPETGVVNITQIQNIDAVVEWQRSTDSGWETVATETSSGTGRLTGDLSSAPGDQWRIHVDIDDTSPDRDGDFAFDFERLEATTHEPEVSVLAPEDGAKITESSTELEVDVSDGDFDTERGDNVSVTFYDGEDSVIDQQWITSNQTVNTTWTGLESGDNEWYTVVEDDYGGSDQTTVHTVTTPNTLNIYNETDPESLVDGDVTVTVQFFEGDQVVEKTTSNGTVHIDGVSAEDRILVQADGDGYHSRRIIIDSIFDQQEIFLLPESANSVEVRFELEDYSGEFDESESYLVIEKPITRNNETVYLPVVADEFGVTGVTSQFEEGARYRLVVENDEGDRRQHGSWTASVSETVLVEIGQVTFDDLDGESEYQWGAQYVDDDGAIQFHLNDSQDLTSSVDVRIYQRGNESIEIYNETHSGPFGSLTFTEPLNATQQNETWVVAWDAERDGDTIEGSRVVGKNIVETVPQMDPRWLSFVAIAVIIVLSGALGAVAPGAAAVSSGVLGGVFYYLGWLPIEVGGTAVLVALLIAVLLATRRR